MNLIEQLGGYCMSKKVMDGIPKDGRSYTITRDDTGITFNSSELHDALLNHRRAHNIFEVDDPVVFESKYSKDSRVFKVDSDKSGKMGIRHATDAEIAAGHRL